MNKNNLFPFSYLLIICMVLAGCSVYQITSEEATSDYYPSKRTPNDVAYLEKINQPHEVIGTITINTERRQLLSDVIERMRYEAAVLGADAITNIQTDASGTWKKLPAQKLIGKAYVRANFSATAVAFQ